MLTLGELELGAAEFLTTVGSTEIRIRYDADEVKYFTISINGTSSEIGISTDKIDDFRRLAKYINAACDFAEGK